MIKYLDLQKINASFEPELSEALLRVSHSGWYLHGEATARFEEEFAAYCGTSYCVGTGNGLDALTLIFLTYRELGVMNAGDEVIVPASRKYEAGLFPNYERDIYLRVKIEKGGICHFYYSLDGKKYKAIGMPFTARQGKWIGAKVGLFSTTPYGKERGWVDADWFHIDK